MDELAILREAAQTVGVVGILMGFIYGVFKGWIHTRAAVDIMVNQSSHAAKIAGEAMGGVMLADIGEMAEDIKADNKRLRERTDITIANAVESGVAKGIASVYTLIEGTQHQTNDRLRSIEIEVAKLHQHRVDTEDRL